MLKTIFSSFFSTRGPNRSHRESAFNTEKNRSGTTIEGTLREETDFLAQAPRKY